MRHGETNKAIDDSAEADDARVLTDDGREQLLRTRTKMRALGLELSNVKLVLCSPKPRTRESAEVVLPNMAERPVVVPQLFFHPDPVKHARIDAAYRQFGCAPLKTFVGHECWPDLQEFGRISLHAIVSVCINHGVNPMANDDVLVVGHGMYIPAALYAMRGEGSFIRQFAELVDLKPAEVITVNNAGFTYAGFTYAKLD